MLRSVLTPEAAQELAEAVEWYDGRNPGLGLEFLGVVEQAMARVLANPRQAQVWTAEPRYRRQVLRRFPYVLFYEIREHSVEFVAIAHTGRAPGYWTDRTR